MSAGTIERAERLYQEQWQQTVRRVDRMFAYLMLGQWILAIAFSMFFSPYGWGGETQTTSLHIYGAIFIGGLITGPPVYPAFRRAGEPLTPPAGGSTGQGRAFQICSAYSAIVRSLENRPDAATLRIARRVHSSGSW